MIKSIGKKNFSPSKWITLFKVFVLPHYLYAAIAIMCRTQKNKTAIQNLKRDTRRSFKTLMGLKKTTPNQVITKLLNFDVGAFANKMLRRTQEKWGFRRNRVTTTTQTTDHDHNSKRFDTKKLSWELINLWNVIGGNCKKHRRERYTIKHLKQVHEVKNQELQKTQFTYIQNKNQKWVKKNAKKIAEEIQDKMGIKQLF